MQKVAKMKVTKSLLPTWKHPNKHTLHLIDILIQNISLKSGKVDIAAIAVYLNSSAELRTK